MRSLGLDIGDRRTGVAVSDPGGVLATPLTVLAPGGEDVLIDEVIKLAEQHNAGRIVIGLPRHLSGDVGEQATKVTAFADRLSQRARQSSLNHLDVLLWDERFSTKAAEQLKAETGRMGGKGASRARRGTTKRRSYIKAGVDAIAASLILQDFLDSQSPGQ
ncbi:MAG: Holliday junction resolvase RuvX [Dehalococcoidia bacterium]|nr:Holliday junction resolvase RuvX [Dehalococcoidia bacterium]